MQHMLYACFKPDWMLHGCQRACSALWLSEAWGETSCAKGSAYVDQFLQHAKVSWHVSTNVLALSALLGEHAYICLQGIPGTWS